MHALNGYNNIFASSKCNYYWRGGDKSPLYVTNNHMMQVNVVNTHWETSIYGVSFIWKIPMHRKKIRLRWLLLMCFVFLSTKFQLDYYLHWCENTMGSLYYSWKKIFSEPQGLVWNTSLGWKAQLLSSLMSFTLDEYQVSKTLAIYGYKESDLREATRFCFGFFYVSSCCNKRLFS
jgi:hypothetical protein